MLSFTWNNMYEAATPIKLTDTRYPDWAGLDLSWYLYRLTYNGGVLYRQRYLEQFSGREDANDFNIRRNITPIPNFVRAALLEIRNAIFQRLAMCCGLAAVSRINWQYPA